MGFVSFILSLEKRRAFYNTPRVPVLTRLECLPRQVRGLRLLHPLARKEHLQVPVYAVWLDAHHAAARRALGVVHDQKHV